MSIQITVISDTHNRHSSLNIPTEGDVIVHCGDATSMGSLHEIETFLEWFSSLNYKKHIMIPGNHDWGFETQSEKAIEQCKKYGVVLLNDSSYTYQGIKFWGSPVQPEFGDWAFNRAIGLNTGHFKHPHIQEHWKLIPPDTDVLITHGPPRNILDMTARNFTNVGCPYLAAKILEVKPKLCLFGHIHEGRGILTQDGITYCNASSLDEKYRPRYVNHFTFDWNDIVK